MKNIYNGLKSVLGLGLILVASISCDSDFVELNSNIEGIRNFDATSELFPFTATTRNFTPFTPDGATDMVGVQSNGINGSLFGIYENPNNAFGTYTASITTQVTPVNLSPDFGDVNEARIIESIWLNIPYFSTLESTDDDGNNTYTLDSIVGNPNVEFNLKIYRSNVTLRDLDPNADFLEPQCYFTNQGDAFEANTPDLLFEDNNFVISNLENTVVEENNEGEMEITERFAPGLRINLVDLENADSVAYWENVFFANQETDVFTTRSNFKDFFRGLIFKVEPKEPSIIDGSLTYLDFNSGTITFDYTNQAEIDLSDTPATSATQYTLNFNGNRVNTITKTDAQDHDGDQDNLYLEGTDGSMAILDLFAGDDLDGNGLSDVEDEFRSKKDKWLINEANLVFYVNQDLIEGDEPDRITLYDLKNNVPIIDYFLDQSTNFLNPDQSKILFSRPLERDDNENGVKYKIRLTSHINNILQRDSTNVKLGLFVANNLNQVISSKIQGRNIDQDDSTLDAVPSTSLLSPKGTVLHGYDSDVNTPLRAEFEIFYTEPEN